MIMAAVHLCCLLLALLGSTTANQNRTVLLYEEDGLGNVIVDLFEPMPQITNLAPVIGDFNPSPLLDSCATLEEGIFPVYGDCTKYLECIQTGTTYTRKIVGCVDGLWFNHYSGVCELPTSEFCTMGRLVPNQEQYVSANPVAARNLGSTTTCTRPGIFPLPGCVGYVFCSQSGNSFTRFEFICSGGYLWDELNADEYCVSREQISFCSVPAEDETCLRPCVAGDRRTCRYNFIVHEFASMSSIYCGNCPHNMDDCNLPGCITAGGLSKPLVAINRRMPGPTIQVCKGDTLEIEVFNRLSSSAVTIHWHGLHQRQTPHMDGVPYLTQCPIHPGNSFRYRMEADIAGTHMYHSHIGHQESDGLFGAMIIREPRQDEFGISNRYDVDVPDHRVLVWHWFERAAETESLDTRLQSRRREGFGLLINGRGVVGRRYGTDGEPLPSQITTYRLTSGKRHRFRAIFNTALNCPIQISIDGHRLDIVAVDGRPIRAAPSNAESIIMSAGERMDFVPVPFVATNNNAFYMRIRGLNDCDDVKNGVHQYAILRYDSAQGNPAPASYPPVTYSNAIRNGMAFNLQRAIFNPVSNTNIQPRPLVFARDANLVADARILGTPTKRFYIEASFNPFTESQGVRIIAPQLNGITWNSPSFPPLTQSDMLNDRSLCFQSKRPPNCQNRQCQCPHILEADNGDLVELVIADPGGANDIGHPFHLHGFAFRVVTQYTFNTPQNMDSIRSLVENNGVPRDYDGPLKDTVLVAGRGLTIIRFVADNPGYWLFHCHISEHMAQGMALAFKVGRSVEMVKPPSNFPRCGNFF